MAKTPGTPPLRKDVDRYIHLFPRARENFQQILRPYVAETRWPLGKVYNGYFAAVDAELYHSVVRSTRLRRIVEVGTGNSAWLARGALRANGGGRLTVVDPSPTMILPRECELIQRRVEEAPPSLFEGLAANDILFVDSSHTAEEAQYHVRDILPKLREGVVVHYHDIYFPYDWYRRGEQDTILEFLRQNGGAYEVWTSAPFVCYEDLDSVCQLVPSFSFDSVRRPGSLWIRKKKDGS